MLIDARLPVDGARAHQTAAITQIAEKLDVNGLWTGENKHDAFLPLAVAAEASERIQLGTAVAIAFSRSPMTVAQLAWDLQRRSHGRFLLGLGTQVRAHVVRRFSAQWDAPAARLRDYALALRAIWHSFQTGERLQYEGSHYSFTLMAPTFDPGPIEHPTIPIWTSGVGAAMARSAGGYADGFHVHPFHSRRSLDEIVRPAIATGARRAGRDPEEIQLASSAFVISSDDGVERDEQRAAARERIAFYGSTPSYRSVLAVHGWEGVGERLGILARERRWVDMPSLITDDMMEAFAIEAAPAGLAQALRARYEGAIDRIAPFAPLVPEDQRRWSLLTGL